MWRKEEEKKVREYRMVCNGPATGLYRAHHSSGEGTDVQHYCCKLVRHLHPLTRANTWGSGSERLTVARCGNLAAHLIEREPG